MLPAAAAFCALTSPATLCPLLPPRSVETEQGWKIKWDVFHHPPAQPAEEGKEEGSHHGLLHRLGDRLNSLQHSLAGLLPHFGHNEPAPADQQQAAPGSGGKARTHRGSVDVRPLPRPSIEAALARDPARAASLPSALDAAPLYELHHHHRAPIGIPETITEGRGIGTLHQKLLGKDGRLPAMCLAVACAPNQHDSHCPGFALQVWRRTSRSLRCLLRPAVGSTPAAPCAHRLARWPRQVACMSDGCCTCSGFGN